MRKLVRPAAILLLLLYFALGMVQVRHASFTVDEGPHLAVGYAPLRTGDYRLQPVHIHPPLANFWAAWPLLLQDDLPDPRTLDGWDIASLSAISDGIVWRYPDPAHLTLVSRVPILLWGVLLGAILFRWTRRLGGWGLLALTLYAFDPNLLAHGGLVTTDMGATLFIFATACTLWELGRAAERDAPTLRSSLTAGVLLGLAQLTKVSTLLLLPLSGLVVALGAEHAFRRGGWQALRRQLLQAGVLFGSAALVLWAGYGFQLTTVEGLPFPLPAGTHVRIFQSLYAHYEEGHPAFLAGRLSRHGWWWYFPFAFAVKTPLPTLLMTAVTALWALRRRWGWRWLLRPRLRAEQAVFALPWLYLLSSLMSSVNIGYRHLLPLLPFLFLGIGVSAARHLRGGLSRLVLAALLAWLAVGTVRVLPYPLTFFNETVGGPEGGYRYLVDSNLDWGQNLWDLAAWMEQAGVERVRYAHYSPARPEVYGVRYDRLPPAYGTQRFPRWNPPPGDYAIGATVLQGDYTVPPWQYEWFRAQEPIAVLGHALFLYHVPATQPPPALVLCADPVPPIPAEEALTALGTERVRLVESDCRQSIPYPVEGRAYLVLPPDLAPPSPSRSVLHSRGLEGETILQLVEIGGFPAPAHPLRVEFQGPLTLLGYEVRREGEQLELRTTWAVKEGGITRPLSLIAHLADSTGQVRLVADGLGCTAERWEAGDRFVETHRFNLDGLPPGDYTLLTGAYWLDDPRPWPTAAGEEGRIPLTTFTLAP